MALADEGKVLVPLRNPHSLMVFYTLAANLGTPCADRWSARPDRRRRRHRVYDMIAGLFRRIDPECLAMDPIAVEERMSEAGLGDRLRAVHLRLCQLCARGLPSAPPGLRRHPRRGRRRPARLGDRRHRHRRVGPFPPARRGDRLRLLDRRRRGRSAAPMRRRAASPATPRRGRTTRSTPRPAISIVIPARRSRPVGFARATMATWSSRMRASARLNRALEQGEDGARVVADLNDAYRGSFR